MKMRSTKVSSATAPEIDAGGTNEMEMATIPLDNEIKHTVPASPVSPSDPEDAESQPDAPVSEDVFGPETDAQVHYKTCQWYHASILMIAETISLGVLALPGALASLGFAPGILLIVVLGVAAGYTGHLIGEFKLQYPNAQSFADGGHMIAGSIGREIVAMASLLVLIFISAAHVLSFAIALNVVTDHATCTVVFSAVGLAGSFLSTLPRTLKNVSYLSVFSCASIIAASTVAMISIAIQKPGFGDVVAVRPGVPLVKGMGPVMNITLAYSGHVTFFGIYSELRDPREYKKALAMTQTFTVSFYILLASVIYFFAGPSVASPALGSAAPLVRKIAFGIALPTIVISGVINCHVACKYLYIRICGVDTAHRKSAKALLCWVAVVAAAWIVSFTIAEAVPNFNVLLGLIAALFCSWFSYGLPPILWLYMSRMTLWNSKKRVALTVCNLLLILMGTAICGLGMWNAGFELAQIKAGEIFSCKSNWQPRMGAQ